nr:DNA glycosylase superfamily protein isoform 1 [Ipomoea batatas]
MSGATRVRSKNVSDSEEMAVYGPAGNKSQKSVGVQRPLSKPLKKGEKAAYEGDMVEKDKSGVQSMLRRHEFLMHSNLSLSASCSSDASTDSFRSRASMGQIYRTSSASPRWKQSSSRSKVVVSDSSHSPDSVHSKKRCAWVTPNTDLSYANFHDEEWGVPVHDDKKLFELLVLCGALAELTWPSILSKRHIFREVFADFDPVAVAKFNERKIIAPGSTASSLLSELKLRTIIENARQVSKIIQEFGSFDNYIWSFVNHKPTVSRFSYARQVPVKTPKADVISKDLVRRGFRGVGPTVIYSFMQAAGITNDHLISCFRFQECVAAALGKQKGDSEEPDEAGERADEAKESEMCRSIDELSFSSE